VFKLEGKIDRHDNACVQRTDGVASRYPYNGREAIVPHFVDRQQSGPESEEGICGEAVPLNGADSQARRRAHMRALTMARQAAEHRVAHPSIPMGTPDRTMRLAARVIKMREELARINAEHQAWLLSAVDH
jgi:hypothetical protein